MKDIFIIDLQTGKVVKVTGATMDVVLKNLPHGTTTDNEVVPAMRLLLAAYAEAPMLSCRVSKLMDYIRTHDLHKEMDGVKANLISRKICEVFDLKLYDESYCPYFVTPYTVLLEAIIINLHDLSANMSAKQLVDLAKNYYPIYCDLRTSTYGANVPKEDRHRRGWGSWFDQYDKKNANRITHAVLNCEFLDTEIHHFLSVHEVHGWGFARFTNYLIGILKAIFTTLEEEQT